MKLGTTYICVEDMEKSLKFYKALLQKEPFYCNDDRWIAFDCGNQIALYNKSSTDFLIIFSNLRKCWKGLLYQAFPAFCVSEDTPHIMAFRSLTWR